MFAKAMPVIYIKTIIFSWLMLLSLSVYSDGDLEGMSLQEIMKQNPLLHTDSQTASAAGDSIRNAPAAMVVIDRQEMDRRGYDSLDDILYDLPGFDTVTTNGTMQVVSYQRGYRTPWLQRTLFLINGKVDNNLWNHSAQFSRQYPLDVVDRIEVLYGPAGAVYGPNAFLGVINIITRDGAQLQDGDRELTLNVRSGSFDSRSVDLSASGRNGEFWYNLGGRWFESDEADIDDYADWGYTRESLLRDPQIWGAGIGLANDPATGNPSPVGDINVNGRLEGFETFNGEPLGYYSDLTENLGFLGEVGYRDWTLGVIYWETEEGYGPYYSFADGQPGNRWFHDSLQLYLEHNRQWSEDFSTESRLLYRQNAIGGDWAESFGGFVSLTDWFTESSAWRFEQQYNYQWRDDLRLSAGIKYEQKALAKLYMICNYWDGAAVCPAQAATAVDGVGSDGSGVLAANTITSLNPLPLPPDVGDSVPGFNIQDTIDRGVFGEVVYDHNRWRFNLGLRWDDNSVYGHDINPRLAAIYHWRNDTTFKLIYGEAFQEPSAKDLYGGWSGRASNPGLKPEKVKNLEFIAIHQGRYLLHDLSLFIARYTNVIAGAENVGKRRIQGLEYRGSFHLPNLIKGAAPISGNLYYTYLDARASQQYDNGSDSWVNNWDDQGDVAPHKLNILLNVPLTKRWNFNLRTQWVSERDLFSQNPLRADSNPGRDDNRKAEAFTKVDMNLLYNRRDWQIGFKIENLLEEEFLQSGVESASSGDDFTVDADGFQNSLLPQVKERIYTLTVKYRI
jgi:iron complex outermembrane receptor protein